MKLTLLFLALIQFQPQGGDPPEVVVRAEHDKAAILSLHRVSESGDLGPAMFGETSELDDGSLVFEPAVSLSRGGRYRAVLNATDGSVIESEDYKVPGGMKANAPKIVSVFPNQAELPANLLKFYIQFDQPMREGREVFDLIRIIDDRGMPVHAPWRRQELWSADATRLTLWIHPGRVKKGVNLREQLGPVLSPGRNYTLRISSELRAASGLKLGESYSHSFATRDEINERVDPREWKLRAPAQGTHDPLLIHVDRGLDPVLMARHLKMVGAEGRKIPVKITQGETSLVWALTPESNWEPGRYRLIAGEYLEDLAGNTPARVFDTDLELGRGEDIRSVETVFFVE